MKSIIKKILKESVNRKHIFVICQKIDSYLVNRKWKGDFFGEYSGNEMADAYDDVFNMLLDKFGYSVPESREILGVYYETYKDVTSEDIIDPDDIIIPEKSKYETFFDVMVTGRQSGKMKTIDMVYSPPEAAFEIKMNSNFEKTIENDDTEWDDWEIEMPYRKKY